MDYVFISKLAAVVIMVLVLSHLVLNAALGFIARFADQVRKITRNVMITLGVVYVLALLVAPEQTLGISQPLIRLIAKAAPGFLGF